jgi:phosphoglycolate phosphatase
MLFIFDFDGTIADSLDIYIEVINKHFKTDVTRRDVRTKGTVKLIKESGIPMVLLPLYILKARKEVGELITKIQPIKGVKSILSKLQTKHELAIVTSNSKANVVRFLEKEGMLPYFGEISDSLTFQGKHKKIIKLMKKLNYFPEDTIYVGDEARDVAAAKRAGIKSIAVTWGYDGKELLKSAKPDLLLSKPVDLLSLNMV